ncbi:MAG: Biopolymer transport protein ExbD/TolR [Flavipsychrobacter sp.]|jgi:biopolymer transport protein ExbD|nr:Biopolymer transport protein ExbD/TolR [Flavipsychrobacter sp.]
MPKVKMPRKSTNVDMTAMCDVAFLLLTFFMLATKFKPDEPVMVKTPASISEIPIPDNDIMLITVDPAGRIFFSIDNKNMRKDLIEKIDEQKGLSLTDEEKAKFAIGASVGVPFTQLKSYLAAEPEQQKEFDKATRGIPADTSVLNEQNELATWIKEARYTNPKLRIVIKADGAAAYPEIKKIISTLQGWKIFKFNLLTSMKEPPAGTAAYDMKHGGAPQQ